MKVTKENVVDLLSRWRSDINDLTPDDVYMCQYLVNGHHIRAVTSAHIDGKGWPSVDTEYSVRFDDGIYMKLGAEDYGFIRGVSKAQDFFDIVSDVNVDVIDKPIETGKPEDATQYTSLGIEPIEIMRKNFTKEQFIGFLKGNVVKYTFRKKGQGDSDLNKLVTYSKWLRAAEHDRPIQIGDKVVEAPKEEKQNG